MPTKWERMVEKVDEGLGIITRNEAVKLLARQHARMVQMVREIRDRVPFDIPRDDAEQLASQQHIATCRLILAALAKEKGGKK